MTTEAAADGGPQDVPSGAGGVCDELDLVMAIVVATLRARVFVYILFEHSKSK